MLNTMEPSIEIRKLSPSCLREITKILEYADSWKRLMSIIPKTLERNNYNCDIKVDNLPKYSSEHFRLIENASIKYKRECTEILFDEWGTSGRIRPTLGHLLHLLVRCQLFRAADYVAVELLKQPPPQRPSDGPAALIPIDIPRQPQTIREYSPEDIDRLLDAINYPSSAIEYIRTHSDESNQADHVPANVIPQIVISESPDSSSNNEEAPSFTVPVVVPRKPATPEVSPSGSDMMKFSSKVVESSESNASSEVSDMVKFSANCNNNSSEVVPQISMLLNNTNPQPLVNSDSNLPDFNLINNSNSSNYSTQSQSFTSESPLNSEEVVPAFSQILNDTTTTNLPIISENLENNISQNLPNITEFNMQLQESGNIPNLSALNIKSESELLPNLSAFLPLATPNQSRDNTPDLIPNFSALQSQKELNESNTTTTTRTFSSNALLPNLSNNSQSSSNNSKLSDQKTANSRPCISPLPNLSLNTLLPHFSYHELQTATNSFNATPYSSDTESGRWLGSGAFGTVFLAIGLFEKPVAVKKLVLDNVNVVNEDDTVTKQFRNEVEVLSKYKHENLLSLLGYSCDGCTYCLLYEFIPGGALKDRLQSIEDRLIWTERLYIAMGTSRAVSYLHTAFSTPLIHRDVKTANILLDLNNKPKLCDFGLIKLSPNQNTNTGTTVFGTSAYMAPEAFRGDISVKLDTFSFGVVLLELLTALAPLDENREGRDLVTHVDDICENDGIKPLLDTGAGPWVANDVNFADELFEISLKCLEEKKKRPNMVEVTQMLDQLMQKAFNY